MCKEAIYSSFLCYICDTRELILKLLIHLGKWLGINTVGGKYTLLLVYIETLTVYSHVVVKKLTILTTDWSDSLFVHA